MNEITEWTFCFVLTFGLILALLIFSKGNISFLKFWNLEVKFREVQKAKNEVQDLALMVADLAEMMDKHMIVTESFNQSEFDLLISKIRSVRDSNKSK